MRDSLGDRKMDERLQTKKNNKTLWPHFMDGIQLPQG